MANGDQLKTFSVIYFVYKNKCVFFKSTS